jgi:hypothetical protein
VLGALGSRYGAILGAAAFLPAEELLSGVTEHWRPIFGLLPIEGPAPPIRAETGDYLDRLKREGQSALIVDKAPDAPLRLAERHVVIEKGRVVWSGSSAGLITSEGIRGAQPRDMMGGVRL